MPALYPDLAAECETYAAACAKWQEIDGELRAAQQEREAAQNELHSRAGVSTAVAERAAQSVLAAAGHGSGVAQAVEDVRADAQYDFKEMHRREKILRDALQLAEREVQVAHSEASRVVCLQRRPGYLQLVADARATFNAALMVATEAEVSMRSVEDTGAAWNSVDLIPVFQWRKIRETLARMIEEIDRDVGADLPKPSKKSKRGSK